MSETDIDLLARLRTLATNVKEQADQVQNEEATKTAFVLPFIRALGYDDTNPAEVKPEYKAEPDQGTKKGERVDYALCNGGPPFLLVETKRVGENLEGAWTQLYRYCSAVETARFGVLTDGRVYRFHADLVDRNRLDRRPFLTLDLRNLDETLAWELRFLCKSTLDVEAMLHAARRLKFATAIQGLYPQFAAQFADPSDRFVRGCAEMIGASVARYDALNSIRRLMKEAAQQAGASEIPAAPAHQGVARATVASPATASVQAEDAPAPAASASPASSPVAEAAVRKVRVRTKGCELCGKERKGKRRRCPQCDLLVNKCCWSDYGGRCATCYDRPKDREGHLKRIEARHKVLVKAIAKYEDACSEYWDYGRWKDEAEEADPEDAEEEEDAEEAANVPPADDALRDLRQAIKEAAEDLGVSEDILALPNVEMPDAPQLQSYNVAALYLLPERIEVSKDARARLKRWKDWLDEEMPAMSW